MKRKVQGGHWAKCILVPKIAITYFFSLQSILVERLSSSSVVPVPPPLHGRETF